MESIPVCGVAIRNETVAALDAPSFLNDIAVGITPHEHNGNGIPNNVAFRTVRNEFPLKNFRYNRPGINTCIIPANKNPISRYGAILLISLNISAISLPLYIYNKEPFSL
jgi:hypothetical protein